MLTSQPTMSRMFSICLVLALLLVGTHQLPAPIQEVPESSTPAPEQSAKPKPKRTTKPNEVKSASISTDSSKKEPVHLRVTSDAEARKIFTYFPYPVPPTGLKSPSVNGTYQLTVAPQGEVTQIKILKTMGPIMDVTALKAFIRWKAQPGPLRIVDVSWGLTMMQAPIRSVGSHIPRKDSMAR